MKKIITIILALILAVGLVVPASAAFSDVPSNAWYAGDVADVQKYGIIEGVGNNMFLPGGVLTYAQAITMAARSNAYLSGETISGQAVDHWYDPYVEYALNAGLIGVSEIPSNTNDFDRPCTRRVMANLFYRTISKRDNVMLNTIDLIPDVVNDASNHAIYSLYRYGILTGNDKYGTFSPERSITRAETAAILNRVLDPGKRKTVSLEVKPVLNYLDLSCAWTYTEEFTDYDYNEYGVYGEITTIYKLTIAFMNDGSFYGLYYIPNSGYMETIKGTYKAHDYYLDMSIIVPGEDPYTAKYEINTTSDGNALHLLQTSENGLFYYHASGTFLEFIKDNKYTAATCKNKCLSTWGGYSDYE